MRHLQLTTCCWTFCDTFDFCLTFDFKGVVEVWSSQLPHSHEWRCLCCRCLHRCCAMLRPLSCGNTHGPVFFFGILKNTRTPSVIPFEGCSSASYGCFLERASDSCLAVLRNPCNFFFFIFRHESSRFHLRSVPFTTQKKSLLLLMHTTGARPRCAARSVEKCPSPPPSAQLGRWPDGGRPGHIPRAGTTKTDT